jgi:hypothetical protein
MNKIDELINKIANYRKILGRLENELFLEKAKLNIDNILENNDYSNIIYFYSGDNNLKNYFETRLIQLFEFDIIEVPIYWIKHQYGYHKNFLKETILYDYNDPIFKYYLNNNNIKYDLSIYNFMDINNNSNTEIFFSNLLLDNNTKQIMYKDCKMEFSGEVSYNEMFMNKLKCYKLNNYIKDGLTFMYSF